MSYSDERPVPEKLLEHRHWNTHEIEFESAAIELARQFSSAIQALKPTFSWKTLTQILINATSDDRDLIEGAIRLTIFCASETPNRFKAIFPAHLVENDLATVPNGGGINWPGAPRFKASTITVERLVGIFSGQGDDDNIAIRDFVQWAITEGAEAAIANLINTPETQEALIECIAVRLAQGADTNIRGHGATDLIKDRLGEWGITSQLGNTNPTDISVSEIAPSYEGPRKYDTVVWNSLNELVLVSQSQMYSSDVGSIQGKTVEEDVAPNRALKESWPAISILTHTEGFGCHTTMRSRLQHVMASDIDGFIQLRTLDTKLRAILRSNNCCTLLDFEICILENGSPMPSTDLIPEVARRYSFSIEEVEASFARYAEHGMLGVNGPSVTIVSSRLLLVSYYRFIDQLVEMAMSLEDSNSHLIRIGGLPVESGISEQDYTGALAETVEIASQWRETSTEEIESTVNNRGLTIR